MDILFEERGNRARYLIRSEGHADSELTYVKSGGNVIVADHTFVPTSLRGKGIAKLLVDRLIEDARAKGLKVHPACSYVQAVFDRDKTLSYIRA